MTSISPSAPLAKPASRERRLAPTFLELVGRAVLLPIIGQRAASVLTQETSVIACNLKTRHQAIPRQDGQGEGRRTFKSASNQPRHIANAPLSAVALAKVEASLRCGGPPPFSTYCHRNFRLSIRDHPAFPPFSSPIIHPSTCISVTSKSSPSCFVFGTRLAYSHPNLKPD
jgi:hypothetical protein